MDVVPILSTIILISTIITLIVAVASYMTFRVKEKKKQAAMAQFQDVFADDMKTLMEHDDGVTTIDPVPMPSAPTVVSTPLVMSASPAVVEAPPASAPTTTTVVVQQQPPVVVGMPYQVQQGYPQQQPMMQPTMAQQMEQYQQQQYAPPPPPEPAYSGAQAAFMKGFGGQTPPPAPSQQNDGQVSSMRKFTMPEARAPRKETPENHRDETPVWK